MTPLVDVPERYIGLHAQMNWVSGWGELANGRRDAALPYYEAALNGFTRLGEQDYAAAVNNLMAEAYDYVDSPEEAWAHREAGFELVSQIGPASTQSVQLLLGAAQLLLANHEPAVANIMIARALQDASVMSDRAFTVDTRLWQSLARQQPGRFEDAPSILRQARGDAAEILYRVVRT